MYTGVRIQSVKPEPGTTGIDVILVARGPDVPDVPEVVAMNGVPFDLLVVRQAAKALLDRLNATLTALAEAQTLVGTAVDVTGLPVPPVLPFPHVPEGR
jgi:hypothetical protein